MGDRASEWFGAYQALDVVQQSETAIVYRGHQPSLGRTVAIRVLLDSRNPQFAARFRREARAVAQLEHHNILPIYDYGEQNGMLYVVTQHFEHGTTLQDILGDPMEPLAALRLISGILEGLQYAHRHNVVHRNIKPASILLPLPEWPVLADFGIARFEDDDHTMTLPIVALESARYMAPEFVEGQTIDARTDLYSLGAVFYHMVVGSPPFDALTPLAVLHEHANTPLPDPHTHNPALPEVVSSLIVRSLAKTPAERFPHAQAMLEVVRHGIAQLELSSGEQHVQQTYLAGIRSFAEGDWSRAIDQLQQVQSHNPQHGHTTRLIEFAQQAQRRAQQQAQAELVRLQKHGPLPPVESTTIIASARSTPQTQRLPEASVNTGGGQAAPFQPDTSSPIGSVRARRVYYIAAALGAVALIVLLFVVINSNVSNVAR